MNYEKIYIKLNEESPLSLLKYIDNVAKVQLMKCHSMAEISFIDNLKLRADTGNKYDKLDKIIYDNKTFISECIKEYSVNSNTYKYLKMYLDTFKIDNRDNELENLISRYLSMRNV